MTAAFCKCQAQWTRVAPNKGGLVGWGEDDLEETPRQMVVVAMMMVALSIFTGTIAVEVSSW